jgi:nicotinamidase-related amidase
MSCGAPAWAAIERIAALLNMARTNSVPVIYSRNSPRVTKAEQGGWSAKVTRGEDPASAHDIVDELSPAPGDLVVTKASRAHSSRGARHPGSWALE